MGGHKKAKQGGGPSRTSSFKTVREGDNLPEKGEKKKPGGKGYCPKKKEKKSRSTTLWGRGFDIAGRKSRLRENKRADRGKIDARLELTLESQRAAHAGRHERTMMGKKGAPAKFKRGKNKKRERVTNLAARRGCEKKGKIPCEAFPKRLGFGKNRRGNT